MTFFRDRYQGVGAIAADDVAPRSAPAPMISGIASRDYKIAPELIQPRHERVRGRTKFLANPRVQILRTTGQRPPMLLSGVRRGQPPPGASSAAPISEVEQRMPPLVYGSRMIGGPRSMVRRRTPGADLQIGTGIGTPGVANPEPVGYSTDRDQPPNYRREPTTLIAREGYSDYVAVGHAPGDLGAVTCDPNTQYFDSQYTQTCRAFSDVGPPKPETHWYDFLTGAAGAAAKGYAAGQQPGAQVTGAMPPWILPVVIGGVGLMAVMLVMRPRATANPARRRRRGGRRGARRRNPSTFTAKGERMYRHIRDQYRGDPMAKEIAARTVYARAKRAKGLVRTR